MDTVDLRALIDKAIDNYLYEREPQSLYDAVRHLPSAGGKRLRPVIACLACEAVGGSVMDAVPFATSLEIIHTFTLIHDDIMDKDNERRGMPAVHAKWDENTAILAGDTLFAKAFEIASYTADARVARSLIRHLAIMSREICEGQQLDMTYEQQPGITERQFLDVIEKKTAKMFEYAAFGGAIVGGGTERQQKALQQFGKNLGIGFQIWDDCLDVIGADIGKPVGSDIREGKRTLLYLYAKAHSEDTAWQQTYGDKDASDGAVRDVVEHLKKIGAVAYAQKCAAAYVTAAQEALLTLPDSEARTTLLSMADFAVNREK